MSAEWICSQNPDRIHYGPRSRVAISFSDQHFFVLPSSQLSPVDGYTHTAHTLQLFERIFGHQLHLSWQCQSQLMRLPWQLLFRDQ